MKKFVFFTIAFFSFNFVNATTAAFSEIPNAWRVESYAANLVMLWHTPAVCGNGMLSLPATATVVEHNRLYATVLSAKATGAKVFVQYNSDNGVCVITSFGVDSN
jgi:hypothetical protein